MVEDGRGLSVDGARQHIAGLVVINDFSARDVQFHEMRIGMGPAKGCLAELWGRFVSDQLPPLQVGDLVTASVEDLGETRNPIVAGAARREIHPWANGRDA